MYGVGDLLLDSDWIWLGYVHGVWLVDWYFHMDRVGHFLLNVHRVGDGHFLVDGDLLDVFIMVPMVVLFSSMVSFVVETSLLVLGVTARHGGHTDQGQGDETQHVVVGTVRN
uniref:Uncharacterized protein n=1 Tax=Cacopsylla melanoneura TaxID=428564 RepID=A0A8D9BRG1_9HEMI